MTLDLAKFISNSIKTQAKIQHLEVFTKATSQKSIPESVSNLISKQYGEKYLLDSDYVAFFWGHLDKKQIEKLFNVVDKALGKSANKLTETDFKKLKLDSDEPVGIEDDQEESGPEDEELEEPVENEPSDDETEDDSDENDSDKELNEDENEEATSLPTTYFFLKITIK